MKIELTAFKDIDLEDSFFDSLKQDYKEFPEWFKNKGQEKAFIVKSDGKIQAFVYLKEEDEAVVDVEPHLEKDRYLKIGTFKVKPVGTKLGEAFLKEVFEYSIQKEIKKIYVTIFPKHEVLINLLIKYGFYYHGKKGNESVYLKKVNLHWGDVQKDYPLISLSGKKYLLSVYPEYHTKLFSQSLSISKESSYNNTIEKVYICRMRRVQALQAGDIVVIYKTTDKPGSAYLKSAATSLCMVKEIRTKQSFENFQFFCEYCIRRSIFSKEELEEYYNNNKNIYLIKMIYNLSLKNQIIRKDLIQGIGLSPNNYWGFMEIDNNKFDKIIQLAGVDDSLVVS